MDKADRLIYGESAMTHAMVFTAVSCDVSFAYFRYSEPVGDVLLVFFFFRKMERRQSSGSKILGVRIAVKRAISLCQPIGLRSLSSKWSSISLMCLMMC